MRSLGIVLAVVLVVVGCATGRAAGTGAAPTAPGGASVALLAPSASPRHVTVAGSPTLGQMTRGASSGTLALSAAKAGTDMILVTGSEATTSAVYTTLLDNALKGSIPRATLRTSYDRIVALKAGL